MSRGFVKEGDQEEIPYVPPRAFLPPGVTNYVTKRGLEALLAEKEELLRERDELQGHNENDRRVSSNFINSRLQLLEDRIQSARVIKLSEQPHDEIRFGATIELLTEGTGVVQVIQITGVDEAYGSKGKMSFISPLARVLSNKKAGDKVKFKRGDGEVVLLVQRIIYSES